MKTINSQASMEFHVTIKITEAEARALEALVGYGFKPFRDTFYKYMGEHYMKPHEKGLEDLFKTVSTEIKPHLHRIDRTKATFKSNPQ